MTKKWDLLTQFFDRDEEQGLLKLIRVLDNVSPGLGDTLSKE